MQQCPQPSAESPFWALWALTWAPPEPQLLTILCVHKALCRPLPLLHAPPPRWSQREGICSTEQPLSTGSLHLSRPIVLSRTTGPFTEHVLFPLGAGNFQVRALPLWDLLCIWNELKPRGLVLSLGLQRTSRSPPSLDRGLGHHHVFALCQPFSVFLTPCH